MILFKYYYKKIKMAYVNTLARMYSPMFDKKFSEMSDDEIKQQLDYWLEIDAHLDVFRENPDYKAKERKYKKKTLAKSNFNNFIKGGKK
jgi:hypothetical protein